MSTRCRIGIKNADNSVSSIYCHHDGYVEGVGKTLDKYWNNKDEIIELIASGDISYLEEDLDKTGFYNDGSSPKLSDTITEYLELDPVWIEYYYLYEDNKWFVSEGSRFSFISITDYLSRHV